MTEHEKLQLIDTLGNEAQNIHKGLKITESQLAEAGTNLASSSNSIGAIQVQTNSYKENLQDFKNRASDLSQKLNKLKKGLHSSN